jgi:valyl-tRNA synthetase
MKFALQFVDDFMPTPTLASDLMASCKMQIRDKFMISKLMKGIETVEDCLACYKFGDAQKAAHSLWIDDICAVYLELIKPVVYDREDDNKERRWAAQATLWLSMDAGLKLLHPMMPFVTEELWQRMPGRGTLGSEEKCSIMISRYPEANSAWKDEDAEVSMHHTMKVIDACRKLRASYSIPHKTLTRFYVRISGDGENCIKNQLDDIKTLGRASSVEVNGQESAVVGTVVVDDALTVLMDVKGLVDYGVEISRLQTNLTSTVRLIDGLEQKIQTEGYEDKVPADLKEANAQKLESLLAKKKEIEDALSNLERLADLDKQDVK